MRDIERTESVGWAQESQERRAFNRESSAQQLTARGFVFVSNNGGAHLVVTHGAKVVDFWPGTGKYIPRGFGKPGRGVFNLIKLLLVKPC